MPPESHAPTPETGSGEGDRKVLAALRAELLSRADADQAVRHEAAARWPAGTPVDATDPLYVRWQLVDRDNTAWLTRVVDEHGWPTVSQVGADGAHAAWLLAQHADHDPAFQQRCLTLMTAEVARQEASATDLAYLVDRYRCHTGQPQLFGTQHRRDDTTGAYVPFPLAEPDTVDVWRFTAGLGPLSEATAAINHAESQPRDAA